MKYTQLSEEEKVALSVAIVYPHQTLSRILPKLFKWKASDSTYYRHHREGCDKLRKKGILSDEREPTDLAFRILPTDILRDMLRDTSEEIRLLENERQKESVKLLECRGRLKQLEEDHLSIKEENDRIKNRLQNLSDLQEIHDKVDFTRTYDQLKSILSRSKSIQSEIEASMEMFKVGSYDSSIVKTYKVSERLVRDIFRHIYGNEEIEKVRKHKDRLKRLWNDEKLEKEKHPGIQAIASLFSTILWYRNKMGAHTELQPTMEAARISLIALLQSLIEIERLGFWDNIYPSAELRELLNKIATKRRKKSARE